MRRLAPVLLAAMLCPAAPLAHAQQSAPPTVAPRQAPPRLIVAISVDQFSADLYAQYRSRFTQGLARLATGAVFPSAYQGHAATETCPGHATLLTGVHPARSGIIANTWFDPGATRADKRIYCAEDSRDPASTARNPVVSAAHLKVPTLGDRLKSINPASRNVAVSAKDRAVMMMGGHSIDAAYWLKDGAFTTFPSRAVAAEVAVENAAMAREIKAGARPFPVPAWCAPRDRAIAAGKATVGAGRFALTAGKADEFRASPRLDAATVRVATRLVDELKLGRGPAPDVLSVSLSATDYIGHAAGNAGVEMCIQMAELDRSIGHLLAELDARKLDYAVVLSADHGSLDLPERLNQQGLPDAARVSRALQPGEVARAVAAQTGIAASEPLILSDGTFGDFYIARSLNAADRARAGDALLAVLRAQPQVAAAFPAAELARLPLPTGSPQDWSLMERARASFDPERSGDVVVLLKRSVVPVPEPFPGLTATHGSPWDYDRRVPLLFWRQGVPGLEQPSPVQTVDIAPTLLALLGLPIPQGAFDGRCLDIDGGTADTCASAS